MLQVSQCERMVDTALVQLPLNVKCTRPPPLSLVIHRPWPPVRQRVVGLPEKLEQHCVVHQNVWELQGGAREWVPGLDPLAAPLHQVRGWHDAPVWPLKSMQWPRERSAVAVPVLRYIASSHASRI